MYQQHKLNFFEQICQAVTRPMKYYRLTKVSSGRSTGFVFLFVLFISLLSILHMLYNIFGPNGFTHFLNNNMPQFDLTDGKLYVSERIEEAAGNSYFLIDTNVYRFSTDDIDHHYSQVILISQSNIINYRAYNRIQDIDFADTRGIHLDNSIISKLLPFFYLFLVFVALMIYAVKAALYFLSALVYSLIGLFISYISHANLTFATIFKTAIYSKVTITILYAIIGLTPLTLPGYVRTGFSFLITCAYLAVGIISHTSQEAYEEAGINVPPQL